MEDPGPGAVVQIWFGNVEGFPVTGIGANVFAANAAITKVIIPAGVTNIGDGAFLNCPNLTSATVPGNVNYDSNLGYNLFGFCTNLTNATVGSGTIALDRTLESWVNLASVTLPNSLTTIGSSTFSGCRKLTSGNIHSHLRRWTWSGPLPGREAG